MEFGISALRRWATEMWLSGESKRAEVGVRTISAPSARRTSTFSFDIFSGMTMMALYPFTAAARAIPMPSMKNEEMSLKFVTEEVKGNFKEDLPMQTHQCCLKLVRWACHRVLSIRSSRLLPPSASRYDLSHFRQGSKTPVWHLQNGKTKTSNNFLTLLP